VSSPTNHGPPSFVGCSVGFAALAATLGAAGGLLLGLALGRPVDGCEPLAQSGLALGALLGLSAALLYAVSTGGPHRAMPQPRAVPVPAAGCPASCSCSGCRAT
jgi:hypothetical protein